MNKEAILIKLQEYFDEVLEEDSVQLSRETTMQNTPQWDSIAHVGFINTIEMELDVEFSTEEIMQTNRISVLVDIIAKKLQ